ncbi:sepiapterin reductase-like [Euwallacea fornicatus]|uniref:sepiapterin reductase-like n=1 Tax=Euwallacea fornicatus TaxID=995702 RepID=UPI0033900288
MATSVAVNFSKKSLIVITGASKGIGQTIAVEMSKRLATNSIFVLLARSMDGLEKTKNCILETDKSFTVLTFAIDLSSTDFDGYTEMFNEVLTSVDNANIEYGYLFHNAGHVGDLKQASELVDLKTWKSYYDLNLFSAILINNAFLRKFQDLFTRIVIINVTSLAGRQPFANMSMYGCAKASRDIFFRVLALEQPNLTVLNYSPGPVLTDMFNSICDSAQSLDLRRSFQEVRNTSVLSASQTVTKLLNLLEEGQYKSGDTVDYFDRI